MPMARRRLLDYIFSRILAPSDMQIGDTLYWDGNDFVVGRRGGGPGTPGPLQIVGPFPIAHDTPGLYDAAGVALFTPAVGDWIVDLWVSLSVLWDNTDDDLWLTAGGFDLAQDTIIGTGSVAMTASGFNQDEVTPAFTSTIAALGGRAFERSAKWTANTPLKVKLRHADGSAGDGTQTDGAADLYVVTATPTVP